MPDPRLARIFRRGSRTYFFSSIAFPPALRDDVFALYAFVRTADDFVDQPPGRQDGAGFDRFRQRYAAAAAGRTAGDPVIDAFVELAARRRFRADWVDAFFGAMAQDLTQTGYATVADTLAYVYGSAEVIGLMMAAIMELPDAAHRPARMLGRAMQYVNFIRDIDEDRELGRTYLPAEELAAAGLRSLDPAEAQRRAPAFRRFVRGEIDRYLGWQRAADAGFHFIPRRPRVAIRTASDMYRWTAGRIRAEPLIVYRRKVRPSPARILTAVMAGAVRAWRRPAPDA